MEIKNIGLEELSLSEQENVNGGSITAAILFVACVSGFGFGFALGGTMAINYFYK